MSELIEAYEEYVALLEENFNQHIGFLHAHDALISSNEQVKRGEELRKKIAELRERAKEPPLFVSFTARKIGEMNTVMGHVVITGQESVASAPDIEAIAAFIEENTQMQPGTLAVINFRRLES